MNYLFEKKARLQRELDEVTSFIEVLEFVKSLHYEPIKGFPNEELAGEYFLSEMRRPHNINRKQYFDYLDDLVNRYQHASITEGTPPPFQDELTRRINKYFDLVEAK